MQWSTETMAPARAWTELLTCVQCIMIHCNWTRVSVQHVPVGGGASIRREWISSTASVSSIYRSDQTLSPFKLAFTTGVYWFDLYRYTPPGRRHPFCRGTDPVLIARLSFPSGSEKVWIDALAQGLESPPLPLQAPASKTDAASEQTGRQRENQNTAEDHICI